MPVQKHEHEVVIQAHDSTVRIALIGATVYSWIAAGQERYFFSRKSSIEGPHAVRGGIPIVWPAFGPPPKEPPFSKLKQHGFARKVSWECTGQTDQSATFTLKPTPAIKEIYEPDFELTYIVEITNATTLRSTLKVVNPSEQTLRFQALLHNYFMLTPGTSLAELSVSPLKGVTYKDKVQDMKEVVEQSEGATISNETDRVYMSTSDHIHLKFGSRGIKIATQSLPDTVFWNPDKEGSDAIGDMEPDGYLRFVCVEPGHVAGWVDLQAQGSWEAGQTLTVDV